MCSEFALHKLMSLDANWRRVKIRIPIASISRIPFSQGDRKIMEFTL